MEIKATEGNTITKSSLQDHQKLALQAAKGPKGLIHKISDASRVRQPFDAFYMVEAKAFVVACFTSHGVCLVFDVDDWEGARYDDSALFTIKL